MENASKALIIAGGILIALLIISLGVYLFRNASSFSESYSERLAQDELNKFNNKFLIYAKDLTPQEMVTVFNLVYENNKKNEDIIENQIELVIDGRTIETEYITQEEKNDIMEQIQIQDLEDQVGNGIIKYEFVSVYYKEDSGKVEKLVYSSK